MIRIANRVRRVCKLLNFAKRINWYVIRPVGDRVSHNNENVTRLTGCVQVDRDAANPKRHRDLFHDIKMGVFHLLPVCSHDSTNHAS